MSGIRSFGTGIRAVPELFTWAHQEVQYQKSIFGLPDLRPPVPPWCIQGIVQYINKFAYIHIGLSSFHPSLSPSSIHSVHTLTTIQPCTDTAFAKRHAGASTSSPATSSQRSSWTPLLASFCSLARLSSPPSAPSLQVAPSLPSIPCPLLLLPLSIFSLFPSCVLRVVAARTPVVRLGRPN